MPATKENHDEDYVAPKDKSEAQARDYEDSHHDRAGHEKQGTSGSAKPHSVRN